MKKFIGGNLNKTNRANLIVEVTLNTSTAVTVVSENPERLVLVISNPTNRDVWLQFQDAESNFSNSIQLLRGEKYEMPDFIYNGEVKAISQLGTPTLTVLEY